MEARVSYLCSYLAPLQSDPATCRHCARQVRAEHSLQAAHDRLRTHAARVEEEWRAKLEAVTTASKAEHVRTCGELEVKCFTLYASCHRFASYQKWSVSLSSLSHNWLWPSRFVHAIRCYMFRLAHDALKDCPAARSCSAGRAAARATQSTGSTGKGDGLLAGR